MKPSLRITSICLALALFALLALAASAGAATLTTKCSGKGPQDKTQEDETASCTVAAGQSRILEGVLRNDKNKPVAGSLKVTLSKWIPAGSEGAFDITPEKEFEIKSKPNGKFKIPKVTTATEETYFIEAVGDEKAEVSPVTAEVNIQRLVTATVKKLGGGSVKVTIDGAKAPLKVGITEEEGYPVSGGAIRKTSKAGVATFHLHDTFGTLNVFFEAGIYTDLYYYEGASFKL